MKRNREKGNQKRLWREESKQVNERQKWLQVKTVSTEEFQVIKQLGRGFYGPVMLVKEKNTGNLYAMKSIQRRHGLEDWMVIDSLKKERQVLMEVNSVWVQRMFHSFLDSHRYIELLEYVPGGSLAALLQQEGNLLEYQTKFYGAEMLMAINVVHRYGFMHRNIDTTNFLLDQFGHVKLSDFGCCLRFLPVETCEKMATESSIQDGKPYISDERRDRIQIYQRKTSNSRNVGRTAFMAPEMVRPRPRGFLAQVRPAPQGTEYTFACDFWSFGVCMYNLLFGQLPFRGQSNEEVCTKIINWRQNLSFPVVQPISDEAKDLMKRLLCDERYRLGVAGCEDVMSHVFFEGSDWMSLRLMPVDVPYTDETHGSGSSVGVPAHILSMLGEGDWASHNDTGVTGSPAPAALAAAGRGGSGGSGSAAGVGRDPGAISGTARGGGGGGLGGSLLSESQAEQSSFDVDDLQVDMDGMSRTVVTSSGNFLSDQTSILPAVKVLTNTSDEERNHAGRVRVSITEAPTTITKLSKTAIQSWVDETKNADPPPDDLQRVAQDDPKRLQNVVLNTMTSKELRRLSKEKQLREKLETPRKEKKKVACSLL